MTYKDIAVMTIQRAIYDYKHALKKDNASVANECEKFFHSQQFDLLSKCANLVDIDGDIIIEKCKKVVKKTNA